MIALNQSIGNGCKNNYVSLDCHASMTETGRGKNNFASALLAASLNKQVTVFVDNNKKLNGYCLATRIDIIF